jgi:hypothetical protein
MNLSRNKKWAIGGTAAVLLLVAFLLFRPDKLFVDDRVDEALADAFPVATTSPVTTTTTATTAVPPTTQPPATTSSTAPPSTTAPPTTTSAPPTTTAAADTATPVTVTSGEFYGLAHPAMGTATVYEQDGQYVLRFEDDTEVENGPDLYVYVLDKPDYETGSLGTYLDLGKLKGNVGGQNYTLPAEFDPAIHQSVLVWCKRFSVAFAAAPLT